MKEQGIDRFLENLEAPSPDPEARLRARRAALAEFERVHRADNILPLPAQESADTQRPSRETNPHGSASMNRHRNRGWYAAAAGIGVVALGLTWVLPNLSRYSEELSRPELTGARTLDNDDARPAGDASTQSSSLPDPSASAADASATGPAVESPATGAVDEPRPEEKREAHQEASPSNRAMESQLRSQVQPQSQPQPRPDAEAAAQAVARAQADAQAQAAGQAGTAEERAAQLALQAPPAPPSASQPAAPADAQSVGGEVDEVIVTGARQSLRSARALSREAAKAEKRDRRSAGAPAATTQGVYQDQGRDRFQHFELNPIHRAADQPLSTFSADVDTASYSFVRAQLRRGVLPQKDAVRSEEMINYFDYAWPAARSRSQPFQPTVVVSDSPWAEGRKLVHIGIKGYELDRGEAPDANLVLLLDVSGSMNAPDKLPLAVRSMEMLLDSLKPTDTVGIVVYAGAAGTVLEPTPVREKGRIVEALRSLRPGGSTAGAEGIELAYELAQANFRQGGVNRILLATDGDFNVGIDSTEELKSFVERKRARGVYLSVLGFGQGNYRDELAQALAQNGNGVAAYIDTENEARKVLVQEASAALFTIARDVKFQVEFDPATVSEYRLVGYETRALRDQDFNNDAVDAGDVGAGHTVTAIYEITPVGERGSVDEPRYEANRRKPTTGDRATSGNEYGFVKIRYKLPGELRSRLISEPIPVRAGEPSAAVKRDVAFSTAVAGFAQLLRGGTYTGALDYEDVIEQAQAARGDDRFGYRAEFIELVRRAQQAERR